MDLVYVSPHVLGLNYVTAYILDLHYVTVRILEPIWAFEFLRLEAPRLLGSRLLGSSSLIFIVDANMRALR